MAASTKIAKKVSEVNLSDRRAGAKKALNKAMRAAARRTCRDAR